MVYRLFGETGDVESLDVNLSGFLEQAYADPLGFLNLSALEQFHAEGGRLLPGHLLSVYPPFVAKESAAGVSLRAIPAADSQSFEPRAAMRKRAVFQVKGGNTFSAVALRRGVLTLHGCLECDDDCAVVSIGTELRLQCSR